MVVKKELLIKENLLKELDSIGYSERAHTVALLGRSHKGTPEYAELLHSLLAGGVYEAQLALIGAAATRDANVILSALKHPKAIIRNQASGLLANVAADDDIADVVSECSHESRLKLLHSISFLNRQEAAERLLPAVHAAWGAEEAAILLNACCKGTVSRWLKDIGYAVRNWRKLASRHPDAVAEYFQSKLEKASPRQKDYVWARFSSAVEILCRSHAELMLDCAMNHGPQDNLPFALKQQLGTLVRHHPDAVYRLLIRSESRSDLITFGVPDSLLKRNKYFTIKQWIGIAKLLADYPVHIAKILKSMAPSKRKAIFDTVYEEDMRKERVFPEVLLYQLPHVLRDKEAERMLSLRKINEYRDKKLSITAALSIDKSRELLMKATAVSGADERAMALVQLIRSTVLSRKGMNETLVYAGRIKNDQDPVRGAVFRELSDSPASMFTDEDVQALTVLVDSVVEARDTSYATRMAVQALALNILRFNAATPGSNIFKFALSTIAKLVKQTGQLTLPSMEENFPPGIEQQIFEELYPLAVKAMQREDYSLVIHMASSFGKKAGNLSELQQLLKEGLKAKSEATVIGAARLWLIPHQTRDERVEKLLKLDKSFITINEVFQHLHRKRQERLTPFISGTPIKGRFLSGKTVYAVPADDGFHRWLPSQQLSFAAILERIATDSRHSLHERTRAIKAMGRIPELSPDVLLRFLTNEDSVIVEAALHALSFIEEPEKALPVLINHLDGDKARVAMYSMPKCIRRVNPVTLSSILKELLGREKLKITVRKEAIRLLGVYRSVDSIPLLMNEFNKPDAHKDVIIAIGHAARQLLDNEHSWAILHTMALSEKSDVPQSLLMQQPGALPEAFRARYLELILMISGHTDPDTGRMAINSMIRWINGNEETIAAAAAGVILHLEDSSRWEQAVRTLTEVCRDGKVNETVIGVFNELASTALSDNWNAGAQRDLPHRQRLHKLANQLASLPKATRAGLGPLYAGITSCLRTDETLSHIVLNLYVAAIDWNDIDGALEYLSRIVNVTSNQRRLLDTAYRQIQQNLKESQGHWSPESVLELAVTICSEGDGDLKVLGLAVLEAAGKVLMWSQSSTQLLKLYRNHTNVEIRSLALDIWTTAE
ncbi:HEAT repeat domain-containing protein [Paenibacillus typhae]|uniref:HEAT repeat domain-containing protein n=1 Tax=Paenibacillus typhae TaxID=1174501 RepID=UPI001C8E46A6|nr:HEAT repeat domain-containing protein [Paenibacillus typhae]MBY0011661.1 HEAT repeat domain-containing protein [Paenibacillus typhae]